MNKNTLVYNILSGGLIIGTLFIMYPQEVDFFEKVSEYGVQVIFMMIMLAMIFLIMNLRRIMFVSLGCAAILCVFLKKHSNINLVLPVENHQPSVSVAHYNLANVTTSPEEFILKLVENDPEIFSFQEYNPYWDNLLSEYFKESHPFLLKLTRIDPYGSAIYSKIPIINQDTLRSGKSPSLFCSMRIKEEKVNFYSAYITPALDDQSNDRARSELEMISASIQEKKSSAIVMGEFNDVYWSNNIRSFRSNSTLYNSRRNTAPGSFEVPYDHIFYSGDLECTFFKNLYDAKSERVGIFGRYQLKIPQEELDRAAFGDAF